MTSWRDVAKELRAEAEREAQLVLGRSALAAHGEAPTVPAVRASERPITLVAEPNDSTNPWAPLDRIKAHTTIITPARAQEILSMLNFERQRAIRPKHVEYLVSVIESGELTDLSLIFVELPDGRRILVDGQHRLTALIVSGRTMAASVTVHRVADEDEIALRYAKIDRQGTRTPQDMLHAFGVDQESGLSKTVLNRISAAVALVSSGFSKTAQTQTKSLIQRTRAVEEWIGEGKVYAGYLSGTPMEVTRLLWRAPVASVALATIRFQPDISELFWRSIAGEEPLERTDPRARLLAYLRVNRVSTVGQYVYCRHVAAAWNACYEGRKLERLQIKDPSLPVRILGTPYGRNV